MKNLLLSLVAVVTILAGGMNSASAKWPPKLKNTPFDTKTWPVPKPKSKGNVSGLSVMSPAQITSDGTVLGGTSNTAQQARVVGKAQLVHEGDQAYWTWTGKADHEGVKTLRRRAPAHDRIELKTDDGGVIHMKPSNAAQAGQPARPVPAVVNPSPSPSPGRVLPSNSGGPQQSGDPWFEVGRSIRGVIEAEARAGQPGRSGPTMGNSRRIVPNNGGRPQPQNDPWGQLGRSIRGAIEAEVRRNQGR
jgi:hypothetical protein